MKKNWASHLKNEELEEILASMEHSDRYILEGCKERLIREAQVELSRRKVS